MRAYAIPSFAQGFIHAKPQRCRSSRRSAHSRRWRRPPSQRGVERLEVWARAGERNHADASPSSLPSPSPSPSVILAGACECEVRRAPPANSQKSVRRGERERSLLIGPSRWQHSSASRARVQTDVRTRGRAQIEARSLLRTLLAALVLLCCASAASAAVLGIDYGSEYVKVSIVAPGRTPISIVINEISKRKSTAAVAFTGGDRWLAEEAMNYNARYPDRVFTRLRDLLGRETAPSRLSRNTSPSTSSRTRWSRTRRARHRARRGGVRRRVRRRGARRHDPRSTP